MNTWLSTKSQKHTQHPQSTVWYNFLTRENIERIDEILVMRQNFSYQIFLLSVANVALATVSSIFYLWECQFVNISLIRKIRQSLQKLTGFNFVWFALLHKFWEFECLMNNDHTYIPYILVFDEGKYWQIGIKKIWWLNIDKTVASAILAIAALSLLFSMNEAV